MALGFGQLVDGIGRAIDLAGVLLILGTVVAAAGMAAGRLARRGAGVYDRFRRDLGRGILLGLELLVAADIIRTVAVSPTLESVAVLAGIVLVRTILSFILELELTGRWPWQRAREAERRLTTAQRPRPRAGIPVPSPAATPRT
jgi:uncharacterized membrane protein